MSDQAAATLAASGVEVRDRATIAIVEAGAITPAQTQRMLQIKRAYQRQLRRKPTALLKAEMERTARLDCEEERVLTDPRATANDRTRAAHAARIQRKRLMAMIEAARPHQPTLGDLMAGTYP